MTIVDTSVAPSPAGVSPAARHAEGGPTARGRRPPERRARRPSGPKAKRGRRGSRAAARGRAGRGGPRPKRRITAQQGRGALGGPSASAATPPSVRYRYRRPYLRDLESCLRATKTIKLDGESQIRHR